MDDIKVTVWCLAYNHEKYIRSALEGFVNQKTNFKYEIIIHDDASNDNTTKIIREYENKYPNLIKPIYQSKNQYSQGVSMIRNFLLPNCHGKYIAFCEGDDYWIDNTKLQKQYDIMESQSDVILCTHKVQYVNEDDSLTKQSAPKKNDGLNTSKKISTNTFSKILFTKNTYPFHTSSFFVRKTLLDSSLFNELIDLGKLNSDMVILLSCLNFKNIFYIDRVMSRRRLFTVNNYNSRFNMLNVEKKIHYYKKSLEGINEFDKLSGFKYQKYFYVIFINYFIYFVLRILY